MTDKNFGFSFSWWVGEVINVKDPYESGRVQVRIYGRHDDKVNIPDKDLPWALPLQPVTSAAHGKLGTAPVGLVRGSKVVGFWSDADQQYPIIMGSFGKSGDPSAEGKSVDGSPKIDMRYASLPAPAQASTPHPYNPYNTFYKNRVLISEIDMGAKLIGSILNTVGSNVTKDVETKMKEPKTPTTASNGKEDKSDIIDVVKKVDPSQLSASLPNMMPNFSTIKNVMSLTSPVGITNMLGNSLGGALSAVANQVGLGKVLSMVNSALSNPLIQGAAKMALTAGALAMAESAVGNGGRPRAYVPPAVAKITPTSPRPNPSLIVTTPPQLYVQQYYSVANDPYPGYIQWKGPNGDYKYTLRGTQPNYSSPSEHIEASHAISMAATLTAGFAAGAVGASLISKMLDGNLSSIKDMGLEKILGAGVSASSILSLAKNLLPNIGGNISGLMSGHLPNSVLGAGVGKAMGAFTTNQALLSVKKNAMNVSFAPSQSDIDSKLKAAQDKLAASEISKLGPAAGSTEVINYGGQNYKVTYTATGSDIVRQ